MRELKFRAWHKKHGMIYPDEYFSLEDAVNGNLVFFGSPTHDFRISDFTFMQFTGLQDANGRDIYEGDILSNKTVVVWIDKRAAFGCHDTHPKHDIIWTIDEDLVAQVEVIGNVYENPDLLKQ